MKLSIVAGATSQSVNVFIQDSSSATGAGLTGLLFNTAGLTAYYSFAGANATATAITLATLAAVNSAFSSGGFKEIDATNMPGWYRLDIPNAALAASKGRSVALHLKGATNMAPCPVEIELTGWDNQDAVHGGLSSLPNATAGANGGLPTGDAAGKVALQASQKVDVDTIKTNPVVNSGTITFPTGATLASTTNITAGTVTAGTVSDKTGYALTAAYDLAKTASQAGDAMALTSGERNSVADALLNRDMSTGTDSGSPSVRTVRQALRFLRNKWSISAGTLTVTKEDDTTASWTATVTTDGTALPIVSNDPA